MSTRDIAVNQLTRPLHLGPNESRVSAGSGSSTANVQKVPSALSFTMTSMQDAGGDRRRAEDEEDRLHRDLRDPIHPVESEGLRGKGETRRLVREHLPETHLEDQLHHHDELHQMRKRHSRQARAKLREVRRHVFTSRKQEVANLVTNADTFMHPLTSRPVLQIINQNKNLNPSTFENEIEAPALMLTVVLP